MSNVLNKADLKLFLEQGLNVMIEGNHGVGKTETIKQVLNETGLNWKYFNGPNIDPFLEFIGVPRSSIPDENGNQHLEMILPKDFADDNVHFIYIDEINRAPQQVINGLMELIQLKSINGKKFKNLKSIFASVNPFDEDGTYAVQKLDAAVLDRFQVQIHIRQDYIDSQFFMEKYPDLAKPFLSWFKDNENYRYVSPRRLEYAINAYQKGINLDYILPVKSNIIALKEAIQKSLRPEPETKKVDFKTKENGDYDIEEAIHAAENNIKIEISLQSSVSMISLLLKDKSLRKVLNYIHPETLIDSFMQPQSKDYALGRQYAWAYMDNYNENINTNAINIPEDTLKFLLFTCKGPWDSEGRPENIMKSNFFKKFLTNVTLS